MHVTLVGALVFALCACQLIKYAAAEVSCYGDVDGMLTSIETTLPGSTSPKAKIVLSPYFGPQRCGWLLQCKDPSAVLHLDMVVDEANESTYSTLFAVFSNGLRYTPHDGSSKTNLWITNDQFFQNKKPLDPRWFKTYLVATPNTTSSNGYLTYVDETSTSRYSEHRSGLNITVTCQPTRCSSPLSFNKAANAHKNIFEPSHTVAHPQPVLQWQSFPNYTANELCDWRFQCPPQHFVTLVFSHKVVSFGTMLNVLDTNSREIVSQPLYNTDWWAVKPMASFPLTFPSNDILLSWRSLMQSQSWFSFWFNVNNFSCTPMLDVARQGAATPSSRDAHPENVRVVTRPQEITSGRVAEAWGGITLQLLCQKDESVFFSYEIKRLSDGRPPTSIVVEMVSANRHHSSTTTTGVTYQRFDAANSSLPLSKFHRTFWSSRNVSVYFSPTDRGQKQEFIATSFFCVPNNVTNRMVAVVEHNITNTMATSAVTYGYGFGFQYYATMYTGGMTTSAPFGRATVLFCTDPAKLLSVSQAVQTLAAGSFVYAYSSDGELLVRQEPHSAKRWSSIVGNMRFLVIYASLPTDYYYEARVNCIDPKDATPPPQLPTPTPTTNGASSMDSNSASLSEGGLIAVICVPIAVFLVVLCCCCGPRGSKSNRNSTAPNDTVVPPPTSHGAGGDYYDPFGEEEQPMQALPPPPPRPMIPATDVFRLAHNPPPSQSIVEMTPQRPNHRRPTRTPHGFAAPTSPRRSHRWEEEEEEEEESAPSNSARGSSSIVPTVMSPDEEPILVNPCREMDHHDGGAGDDGCSLTREDTAASLSDPLQAVCCICLSHRPSIAILPCGHVAICRGCYVSTFSKQPNDAHGNNTKKCPLCRVQCTATLQVRLPPPGSDLTLEKIACNCPSTSSTVSIRAVVPCGHVIKCCDNAVCTPDQCPVCKTWATDYVQVFNV